MIASHYAVPDKPGFINYINFCNDVHNRTKSMEPDAPAGPTIPYGYWPPEVGARKPHRVSLLSPILMSAAAIAVLERGFNDSIQCLNYASFSHAPRCSHA